MSNLKGKVAVVTGASKGIGAGIAKALGEAGASVVVNYASDKAGAEKAVADIKAKGGKAVAVQGDVSKLADVKHLVDETRKAFGKLDVLVNNAGVYKFAPLEEVTEGRIHQRQFGHQRAGAVADHARGSCLVWGRRRQRDQCFFHRQPHGHPGFLGLCRHSARRWIPSPRCWPPNWVRAIPGQFHQSGHGGKRRHPYRRYYRQRSAKECRSQRTLGCIGYQPEDRRQGGGFPGLR